MNRRWYQAAAFTEELLHYQSAKGLLRVWGKQRGLKGALAEYRVFLFEEGSEEKTEDLKTEDRRPEYEKRRAKIQDPRTGEWKTRVGIDARKVWEERKRGGRLPLRVMLRLRSRYLVDGAAIGSEEFLRRLSGKAAGRPKTASLQDSRHKMEKLPGPQEEMTAVGEVQDPEQSPGKPGVAMRFGQWGGLRVLRDLRVGVVG